MNMYIDINIIYSVYSIYIYIYILNSRASQQLKQRPAQASGSASRTMRSFLVLLCLLVASAGPGSAPGPLDLDPSPESPDFEAELNAVLEEEPGVADTDSRGGSRGGTIRRRARRALLAIPSRPKRRRPRVGCEPPGGPVCRQ